MPDPEIELHAGAMLETALMADDTSWLDFGPDAIAEGVMGGGLPGGDAGPLFGTVAASERRIVMPPAVSVAPPSPVLP